MHSFGIMPQLAGGNMRGRCLRMLVAFTLCVYANVLWAQNAQQKSAPVEAQSKTETPSAATNGPTQAGQSSTQGAAKLPEKKPVEPRQEKPLDKPPQQAGAAPQQQPPMTDPKAGDLVIIGKNKGTRAADFEYALGDRLQIRATGDVATQIRMELTKPTASRALALYFDGIRMPNFPASAVDFSDAKEIRFQFHIVRDSNDDENRKAWDTLFGTKDSYLMTIDPALAVGNELPRTVGKMHPFKLYVARPITILVIFIVCLVAFLGIFSYAVKRTDMLLDRETGYYSLGKSQMAFWGLLVLLTFVGVCLATWTMERIPPQALVLLGISGATGLTAVLIGSSKHQELQTNRAALEQEEATLKAAAAQGALPPDKAKRLEEVQKELGRLSAAVEKADRSSHRWGDFWRDICDDGKGASFHRLQVVMWTVVLGVVFVRSVATVMSMPEFSETLLILMGISNATYLGFKIPEPA
jgi:hypothetical protein